VLNFMHTAAGSAAMASMTSATLGVSWHPVRPAATPIDEGGAGQRSGHHAADAAAATGVDAAFSIPVRMPS
jgi:hypothetical protein